MSQNNKEEIGYGGFFLTNIKNWLINECLTSGDPENFFENVLIIVEEMDEDRSWLLETTAWADD